MRTMVGVTVVSRAYECVGAQRNGALSAEFALISNHGGAAARRSRPAGLSGYARLPGSGCAGYGVPPPAISPAIPGSNWRQACTAAWNCGEFRSTFPSLRPTALPPWTIVGSGKPGIPCERMQAENFKAWLTCSCFCAALGGWLRSRCSHARLADRYWGPAG